MPDLPDEIKLYFIFAKTSTSLEANTKVTILKSCLTATGQIASSFIADSHWLLSVYYPACIK